MSWTVRGHVADMSRLRRASAEGQWNRALRGTRGRRVSGRPPACSCGDAAELCLGPISSRCTRRWQRYGCAGSAASPRSSGALARTATGVGAWSAPYSAHGARDITASAASACRTDGRSKLVWEGSRDMDGGVGGERRESREREPGVQRRLHVCVCRIVRPLGESLHRVGIGDLALRRGRRHWPLEQQGQRADQISLALRALVGQRRRRPLESIGGNLEAGIARVLRGRREEAGALVPVVIGPIREGDAPVRHCTRRVRLSCTLEAGDRLLAVQAEGPHAAPVEQELAFSDSGRNRLRVSAEGGRRGVVVQHVYVSQG